MAELAVKIKAKIKPSKIGSSINVLEWLKLLNDETEDVCWPLWYRIQWIIKFGGLANDVENSYRDLVITSLKNPAEKLNDYEGLPYDRTHDRNDQWYWDCMWVEILLWITSTFHFQTTDNDVADVIKKFLRESLELNTEQDKRPQDAFNREAQSIHFTLQKAYRMAEDSMSNLPANPQYIYEYLIEVLKEMTSSGKAPQGEIIARELEQSRAKFARNPGDFITARLPLSDEEIRSIRYLGPSRLTEKHFKMITQSLMEKVKLGQPLYQIQTFNEVKIMTDFYNKKRVDDDHKSKKRGSGSKSNDKDPDEEEEEKGSKKKKSNLAKVNNARTDNRSGDIWSFYTGKNTDLKFEWEKGKPKCTTCGMSHAGIKGPCTWVVFEKGIPIVQTRVIAEYPNVFFTGNDGKVRLGHGIISEFANFGFSKLGITEAQSQQRIVSDLRYLSREVTPAQKSTQKVNNAKTSKRKQSKTADDDEDSSRVSNGSSKTSSLTMAAVEEEYAQSEDSSESSGGD
jgi:hypothetical protein